MEPNRINTDLVRSLRKREKLTQRKAAKEIGVAFATLQAAESTGRVNLDTLKRIADFYKRPQSDFLVEK